MECQEILDSKCQIKENNQMPTTQIPKSRLRRQLPVSRMIGLRLIYYDKNFTIAEIVKILLK